MSFTSFFTMYDSPTTALRYGLDGPLFGRAQPGLKLLHSLASGLQSVL